ncbi:MAG: asparagine synthetase B [ANME-2 cluster archaeon]|nr:asparagine synthetase B [ANME-2 cluster archaeon]
MPGLVGIVTIQNKDINVKELLSKMCHAIMHEMWYKTDISVNKAVGLGRVYFGIFNPEPQPIFNEDRTLCIMMEGEIYDYQDMKDDLVFKGYKFSLDNDPEFILHLYEEYGKDFVHKLNGSFTLVIWVEKSQELLIINDRYGLRPLYYAERNGYLLFGSEVKAILQDKTFKRIVDDRSVADFFSVGYILGNKTFFKGIELVPPASILTYNEGQVSIEQYWDFNFNEEYECHPEEYYIEKLSKLILQAVERQMKGTHRIGVPLSGGLDSRTIVASIDKKHYPIHTFTFGKPNCDDARFAGMIANKLGTVHHFLEFKPDDLASYAEKAVYITDGMLNCIHGQIYYTLSGIDQKIDVTFDGIQGIKLGSPSSELYEIDDDKILLYLLNPLKNINRLFTKLYYFKIKQYLIHFSDGIQNNSGIKLSLNRLNYYTFTQRKRRFNLCGSIVMRSKVETRFPFYDNDVIDFILTVPPTLRLNEYIYVKTIINLFPHLSSVPCQKNGLPLTASNLQSKIHNKISGVKRRINRTTGKTIFEGSKNFADYDNWMRDNKKLREYLLSILLDERTLMRPYFNTKCIKDILDLHMSGKKNYSELIGRLLTFELWHRQFLD